MSESTKANEGGGSNDHASENASLDESNKAPIADNELAQNDQSELSGEYVGNGESKIGIANREISDSGASCEFGGSAPNKGEEKDRGRNPPIKTPGKRNKSRTMEATSRGGRDPATDPRLICFYDKSQGWTVAVEVPGATADISILSSDRCSLSVNHDGIWIIDSMLEKKIQAKWSEGEREFSLAPPLIFRTRRHWEGLGMRQRGITSGYYIVFAPGEWKRKRKEWNSSECRYSGFRVHEFEVLKGKDDVEDGFDEAEVFLFRDRFRLEGMPSFDDERGAIFMGGPPCIVDHKNWVDVEWIVAGVEGEVGREIAPESFQPKKEEENTPEIWKSSKGGWFFVRIYSGGDLIHNPDFRFLRALQDIHVQSSLLPLTGGHRDMVVEAVGADVSVEADESRGRIQVEGQRAVIKPQPGGGNVILSLCADGARIEAEFADPRVWWALSKDNGDPQWADRPLEISHKEFRAVEMTAELLFKLPGRGIVKFVEAGFSPLDNPVRCSITQNQLEEAIPLRSLGAVKEGVVICVRFPGVEGGREIPVLQIIASPPPPPLPSRRRQISGVVVSKARGIVQVRVKRKRGAGREGCRKIRARDRRDRCQKGDRVVVEKLPRHPKAWRVID